MLYFATVGKYNNLVNLEETVKTQRSQVQNVYQRRFDLIQANQSFRDLRVQLEGTENRITVERMNYNTAAQVFNTQIRIFPTSIIAKIFDFQRANLFEATKGAEIAPTVEF